VGQSVQVKQMRIYADFLGKPWNEKNPIRRSKTDTFHWRYSPHLGLGLPPWNSLFHFGFIDLRQSVGLIWRVISSSQGLYLYTNTEKRTHTNTNHPCPEWDSNQRSRLQSERRKCMP
jgi:hypothetical protein